jgi:hypothetical protein
VQGRKRKEKVIPKDTDNPVTLDAFKRYAATTKWFVTSSKTAIGLYFVPSVTYSLASYHKGHLEVLQPEAH